jgi:hypothetical protein
VILSDPIPWNDVPAGAVAIIGGEPRLILSVMAWSSIEAVSVFAEGEPPLVFGRRDTTRLALLDEADAMAALRAADFIVTPIEERS